MTDHHQFPPSAERAASALIDHDTYQDMYQRSIEQPTLSGMKWDGRKLTG